MTVRTRSRSRGRPKGTFTTSTGSIIGGSYEVLMESSSCTDIVAAGDNHPLTISSWEQEGGIINGRGAGKRYADNYVADALQTTGNWPHMSIPDAVLDQRAAVEAAARTNPSRPVVDVPNVVFELREAYDTIRQAGRDLLSQWASNHVKLKFALGPLIKDLMALEGFRSAVDQRISEIEGLRVKGIKKTVTCWQGSAQGKKHVSYQSNGISIGAECSGNTKQVVRAHVRWFPAAELKKYSSTQVSGVAQRSVAGLTLDSSTIWEALPWSWFLDWGTSMGSLFAAHRNIVPAYLHSVTVMRHTKTTWESTPGVSSAATGSIPMSAHRFIREEKTRRLTSVTPTAHLPFLSEGKLSTLLALSVLKGGR